MLKNIFKKKRGGGREEGYLPVLLPRKQKLDEIDPNFTAADTERSFAATLGFEQESAAVQQQSYAATHRAKDKFLSN